MVPDSVISELESLFPEISGISESKFKTTVSPWSSPYTHPMFFVLVLNEEYGAGWIEYEPETIMDMVKDYKPSDESVEKILAIKSCIFTDSPWNSISSFNNIVVAFMGDSPMTDTLQHVYPHEIEFAKDVLMRVDQKRKLSDDVKTYIDKVKEIHSNVVNMGRDLITSKSKRIFADLEYHYSSKEKK